MESYLLQLREEGIEGFEVITTFRNPWDRVVSIYHFGLSNSASIWHVPAKAAGSVAAFCFHPILDSVFGPNATHPEGPFDIVNFTTDLSGRRPCKVFDVRALAEVMAALRERGINVELPHINASNRGDYRSYFDDASAQRIAELFAVDIVEGGYDY